MKTFRILFLVQYGLLFTVLNVPISGYGVDTGIIGSLLLFWPILRLREEDPAFRNAALALWARFALFGIGVFLNFTPYHADAWLQTLLALMGVVFQLALVYTSLLGIRHILVRVGEKEERLVRCSRLFEASVLVSLAGILLPGMLPVCLLLTFGVGIYILTQLRHAIRAIHDSGEELTLAAVGKARPVWLACLLILPVCCGGWVLEFTRSHPFSAEPAGQSSSPQAEMQRLSMKNRGFPEKLLEILPDEEVLLYANLYACDTSEQEFELDGGKLRLTLCAAYLDDVQDFPEGGLVRMLAAYEWFALPEHRYQDSLLLCLNETLTAAEEEPPVNGFQLYQQEGERFQTQLKMSWDLHTREITRVKSPAGQRNYRLPYELWETPVMEISLSTGEGHRGYFAKTYLEQSPGENKTSTFELVYRHQSGGWNFPYIAPLDFAVPSGRFFAEQKEPPVSRAYETVSFAAELDYYTNEGFRCVILP